MDTVQCSIPHRDTTNGRYQAITVDYKGAAGNTKRMTDMRRTFTGSRDREKKCIVVEKKKHVMLHLLSKGVPER
jgi:hypothetical protein